MAQGARVQELQKEMVQLIQDAKLHQEKLI